MTEEERRLAIAVAVLVLFGSAVRWFELRGQEPPPATESGRTVESAPRAENVEEAEGEPLEEAPASDPSPAMVEALRARVDLNRDGAPALETLPGIGPKKARLIVEWREAHGPFRSLGDLDRVPGIGRKTIERIAPLVTIEDRTAGSEGGSASGGREADAGRETSGKDDGLGSRGSSSSLGASHSGAIPEAPEAEGVLGRSDG